MRSDRNHDENLNPAHEPCAGVSFLVESRGHCWIFTADAGDEPSLILHALDLARGPQAHLDLVEAAELALLISRYLTGQLPESHDACLADGHDSPGKQTHEPSFFMPTNIRRSSWSQDV